MLGIGNLVMGDDGAGVRAVQLLEERYRFTPELTLLDGGTLGLDLLPRLEGIDRLLVIDALETGGAAGTIKRLTGNEVPRALATKVSPHQAGMQDLLATASLMGIEPAEIVLWGIQPASVEMSSELSPLVADQIDLL
ncbi:MAG TPA: HyaD/HybD family hydrogenase maturation endopeptidase, partial [Geobacterales bacterium]|nr:HyaD/HybD family hydrogenase maturation endopeptidase [Geobacterales bacterium]